MDKFDSFVAKFVEALQFRDSVTLFKRLRKHAQKGNTACPQAVGIRRYTDLVVLPVAVPNAGDEEFVGTDGLTFANTTIRYLRSAGKCVVPLPLFLTAAECMAPPCGGDVSDSNRRPHSESVKTGGSGRPHSESLKTGGEQQRDEASVRGGRHRNAFALCQVRCFLPHLEREKQLPVSIHIVGHRSGPTICVGKGDTLRVQPFDVGSRMAAVCRASHSRFEGPKLRVIFHVCNSAGGKLR